jgi:integrase
LTETVAQAFDRFLLQPGRALSTISKYRYKFSLFLERHGGLMASAVGSDLLLQWFDYLENRLGYSPGHLAFHRSCHVCFWGWLSAQYGRANPALRLRRYSQRAASWSAADGGEIDVVLDYCRLKMWLTLRDQRDGCLFALGSAGLRTSNLLAVRVSDGRRAAESGVLVVDGGKRPMEAPLDERRLFLLRRWLYSRPAVGHERLFINLHEGSAHYGLPLTAVALGRCRRRVCEMAGVRPLTFQQMRRWFGVELARRHGPLVAAEALGHSSGVDVVIGHYYNPQREQARAAALAVLAEGGLQPSQG